jgi:hypothetical protein
MDTAHVNGKQVGASSGPRTCGLFRGRRLEAWAECGRPSIPVEPDGGFISPADTCVDAGTVRDCAAGEWYGSCRDGRPPQPLLVAFENLPSMPGVLYNGTSPITPLAITGAIWHQESNAERAYQYRVASGPDRRLAEAGQGDFSTRQPASL